MGRSRPLRDLGTYVAPDLPDVQHFKVRIVADLLGERLSTIRFWEQEFGLRPFRRHGNTRYPRYYSRSQVLQFVEVHRMLRFEGYTVKGALKYLRERDTAAPPSPPPMRAPTPDPPAEQMTQLLRELRVGLGQLLDTVDDWERRSRKR